MQFPTPHTARLLVRPFVPDDWPAVYAYTGDAAVMTYMAEGVLSVAQAQAFAAHNSTDQADAAAVVRHADSALLGHILFHPWYAPRTNEIGWALHPDYHGQGYASEAAQALLDYGFATMNLHRIIATCQPENPASARVMEKIGMRREGFFRQCIYRGADGWWDEWFYAILHDEWRARYHQRGAGAL